MGARIDQFCEDLRQKLTIADSGLDLLAEVLVAIVRAESNPTDASNL